MRSRRSRRPTSFSGSRGRGTRLRPSGDFLGRCGRSGGRFLMTEQQGLDSIVDDVLSARETAVSANERFLVELIDIVLLAAAERLVEAEAGGPDASALFFG